MSTRDAFLANVRLAAEQGRPYRVPTRAVPGDTGYLGVDGDLVERFALEVNAVGGEALVVSDVAAAGRQLHALLAEAGARSAVCWKHELLERMGIAELLAAPGVTMLDYDGLTALAANDRRQRLLECDVGITSCDWAIAETGTLVMCSRPGQERLASLLAPMHIAVVERRQIVPDLIDVFWLLDERGHNQLPSNLTLITGPSKTGDIELQLTTGVHGPGKWRVIVIQ
jgi:L-lactate dehydrogenase complex protein LldG